MRAPGLRVTRNIARKGVAICYKSGLIRNLKTSYIQIISGFFPTQTIIASLEGRVGEPRSRPPFPAQEGLWGRPTIINNVETWANVPTS